MVQETSHMSFALVASDGSAIMAATALFAVCDAAMLARGLGSAVGA